MGYKSDLTPAVLRSAHDYVAGMAAARWNEHVHRRDETLFRHGIFSDCLICGKPPKERMRLPIEGRGRQT